MAEVKAEILDANIDQAQLQRLKNGERPGALWHLFRSDDAKKIREYIGRVGHMFSRHGLVSRLNQTIPIVDATSSARLGFYT
jgi:hypothetical protein